MLLPPSLTEGNMVAGGPTVTVEGSIFPAVSTRLQSSETPAATPGREQVTIGRLEAEHRALDSLALENRSLGNVTAKTNRVNALEDAFYADGDIRTTDIEALHGKIGSSQSARAGLRLASKGSLAESLGVKAHAELVDKEDSEGNPVRDEQGNVIKQPKIITDDPSEQGALDAAYRGFRMTYFGTRNRRRLNNRRQEIKKQIEARAASAVVA
jgi:hypothetical protein